MDKALEDMTGIQSTSYRVNPQNTYAAFNTIMNRGFENNVVTCSTPKIYNGSHYVDKNNRFLENHAYSIKSIDTRNQTVEIVNPHNTKRAEIVSWNEFNQIFDYICVAHL